MTKRALFSAVFIFSLVGAFELLTPAFLVDRYGLKGDRPGSTVETAQPSRYQPPPSADLVASPRTVARAFGISAAPTAPQPQPPKRLPASADWLRPVGTITDEEGISRVFIKDLRKGRMLKIRLDGGYEAPARIVDSSDTGYMIELDGELYAVSKK